MKKVLIFVAACFITAGAMAQLKVESNGDVVFPNYVKVANTSGDIYLPGSTQILWGGTTNYTNSTWAVSYKTGVNPGLEFFKPTGSYNAGGYLFLSDEGRVGINGIPTKRLTVFGSILTNSSTGSGASIEILTGPADPRITTGSNKVVFYKMTNTGFANIECGTLTQSSDSTLKTNIHKIEGDILSKVCKLDGYTYNWKDDKDGQLQVGFIAQEVEKVFPELVETVDSSNVKLMSYIGMIPYLLEAIKAQQAQIEDLKEQLGDNNNSAELKSYSMFEQESTDTPASLSQNKPNPFSSATRIEMYVPKTVSNATLYIYDLQGKQVKSIAVTARGTTFETIHGSELPAGLYIYSLVTDGKLVGSKQMVLTE